MHIEVRAYTVLGQLVWAVVVVDTDAEQITRKTVLTGTEPVEPTCSSEADYIDQLTRSIQEGLEDRRF